MIEWSVANVLAAIAAIFITAYLYSKFVALRYWKRRGVPHPEPIAFFGNFAPVVFRTSNFSSLFGPLTEPYRDNGYCGFYQWHMPVLLVWDPEMAKQVLTKEFSSLHDRGQPYDEKNDPLSAHLFNLEGARWRNLRNKLSPTFTSGKLKLMFPLMQEVGNELHDSIRADAKTSGGEVDLKDLLTRFATDVIGTCAFGINCNSLRNKSNEFLIMSREIFRPNFLSMIRFFLTAVSPKLTRFVPFKFIFSKTNDFFLTLMKDTVEYREKNNIERNDFVNLMMQLRDSDKTEEDRENHIEFTHSVMTAQAFIFFLAGLDNISNTVSFCVHQLAYHPDLQRRAAEEVRAVIKEHDGQLSYEALKKMDLVERVVKEGLRLWSPVGFLIRKCTKKVTIGDVVIEKGQMVMVTAEIMHKNPVLYPDPLKFDPDRFTREANEARHPYAFLPFGEGPRICIAERFALMEMKLGLASLLNEFEFSPGSKSEKDPKLDILSFFPQPTNGFWLKVEPRAKSEN